MFRKKVFWIALVILLALAGGGYAYYSYVYQPSQEVTEQDCSGVTGGCSNLSQRLWHTECGI